MATIYEPFKPVNAIKCINIWSGWTLLFVFDFGHPIHLKPNMKLFASPTPVIFQWVYLYDYENGLKMAILSFIAIISRTVYRPAKFVIMTDLISMVPNM